MRNEGLNKTFTAGAAIAKNRIVKFGTADTQVLQGAAATDSLIGVADNIGASSGETIDVILTGVALVEYGGTVARGDLLTADANGKAVVTVTQGNRTIGVAMLSGVAGDIGSVNILPSSV